jgi:hypothetical protein
MPAQVHWKQLLPPLLLQPHLPSGRRAAGMLPQQQQHRDSSSSAARL